MLKFLGLDLSKFQTEASVKVEESGKLNLGRIQFRLVGPETPRSRGTRP